jgi:hypothetical protein
LRVVSAGKVVEAEWSPSDVPGLALVGRPVTSRWRLVHIASGRAVSRSAEHSDPEAVRSLAKAIAHLADWTKPDVAIALPRLRDELDRILGEWRASHPDSQHEEPPAVRTVAAQSSVATTQMPNADYGSDRALEELEKVLSRLRSADRERVLLREVVRRLHASLPPGMFTEGLVNLSDEDRALVRHLVSERERSDVTAVVQAIRGTGTTARTPASPRGPARPRPPRAPGPDVAAS